MTHSFFTVARCQPLAESKTSQTLHCGPRAPFFHLLANWIWPRNVKRLRCLPRLFLFGHIKRVA